MFRFMIGSVLTAAVFVVPAPAGLPVPPAGTDLRQCAGASALADRVVIGRVAAVEKDQIKAKPIPGVTHHVTYEIFRLAVTETLAGDKAVTEVRIGGVVSDTSKVSDPEPIQMPNPVAKDAEGLYFLERHHSGEFYTILHFVPKYYGKSFDRDAKDARRYLKLLADPLVSLRSKEPDDRLTTAVLLLTRHQAFRSAKTVPIPARESKLILGALAEVDWGHDQNAPLHPYQVTHALWRHSQIQAMKAGEVFKEPVLPGKTFAEQSDFLRKWVEKNRDTYRIECSVYK